MRKRTIGLLGASSPVAIEAMRVLAMHPMLELTLVADETLAGQRIADVYPGMAVNLKLGFTAPSEADWGSVELLVSALDIDDTLASLPGILKTCPGLKLVDCSQAFCPLEKELFHRLYDRRHPAPELVSSFEYGWSDRRQQTIAEARRCAVPGAVASALIAALAPWNEARLIAPAVTASVRTTTHGKESFPRILDEPEAVQAATWLGLGADTCAVAASFHHEGLIADIFVPLPKNLALASVDALYRKAYESSSFIRMLSRPPQTRHVMESNRIHLYARAGDSRLALVVALDPVRRIAMQAIACCNLMLGLPEEAGVLFTARSW